MNPGGNLQRNAIIVAGVLLAILAFFTTTPSEETATLLSPRMVSPGGGAAISRGISRLGLGGDTVRTPWTDWCADQPGAVLAVIGPTSGQQEASVEALVRWVEEGGTLIYVPGSASGLQGSVDVDLGHSLGFSMRTARRLTEEFSGPRLERDLNGPGELRDLALIDAPEQWDKWLRVAKVDSDILDAPTESWLVDGIGRPGVALFERGAGRIFLWADGASLRNDRLEEHGAGATFLRSIALIADGEPIFVDGYAHGMAYLGDLNAALWKWLTRSRLGHVVLFGLGVGLLALISAGVRRAPPIPELPPAGRSPLEHIDALADAYRRAKAQRRPTAQLLAAAERRLGSVDLGTRLTSLERHRPDMAPDLNRVKWALQNRNRGVPLHELVRFCSALDRIYTADLHVSRAAGAKRKPRD